MALGRLRSGCLVSSTRGQTNSAPTKPHMASASRAITPHPKGLPGSNRAMDSGRAKATPDTAPPPMISSATTIMKTTKD